MEALPSAKELTLRDRAELYNKAFPHFPPLRADDNWIDGMWVLGNNYKSTGFYGAYPPQLLKRMETLFPDKSRILHLFSGSIPPGPYTRFDLTQPADKQGDAETLATHFPSASFNLIYADPPYTTHDAEKYGTPLVNKKRVVSQCAAVLQQGGFLVWLDQALPIHAREEFKLCGLIGVVRSTNHRYRIVTIFRKV